MINHSDILENLVGHYLGYDNYAYLKNFVRRLSGSELELLDKHYAAFENVPSQPASINAWYTKFIGELFIPTAIDYLYMGSLTEFPSEIVNLNKDIIGVYNMILYNYEEDSFTLNVHNLDAYIKTKYPYLERIDDVDYDKLTIMMNYSSNVKWQVICKDLKSKI